MKGSITGILFALLAFVSVTCGKVTFNMSGASIGNAKTCQVGYFENRADIVIPSLSAQMTDALKDKIQSSSSLRLVNNNADVIFEGEITGYNIQPQQITPATGRPAQDRLTITVKVKFTNMLESDKSYDKSFSRFQEAPSGSISSNADQLAGLILEELMEDIYNEAFANW